MAILHGTGGFGRAGPGRGIGCVSLSVCRAKRARQRRGPPPAGAVRPKVRTACSVTTRIPSRRATARARRGGPPAGLLPPVPAPSARHDRIPRFWWRNGRCRQPLQGKVRARPATGVAFGLDARSGWGMRVTRARRTRRGKGETLDWSDSASRRM